MPIVKMPDGTQVRFPDDMPREQIRDMIASKFPDVARQGQSPQPPQPLQPTTGAQMAQDLNLPVPGTPMAPPKPDAASMTPWLDPVTSFANSAVDAIPIAGPTLTNMRQNLDAATNSMVTGQPYDFDKSWQQQAGFDADLSRTNPEASTAGSVAGAVAPLLALGMTPVGGRMLGNSGTLPQRVAMGGVSGGLITGADALARGDDLQSAGLKGLQGLGLGGAFPLAERMVSPVLKALLGQTVPSAVQSASRNLERDGVDIASLITQSQNLGPDAMLMDIGPNMTRQAGAIASLPGEGQTTLRNALVGRHTGTNARIQGDVNDLLGPSPTPSRVQAGIREGQDALQPHYEEALNAGAAGDITDIAGTVDDQIANEKGPARTALQRVREMLNFTAPAGEGLPAQTILDNNPNGWMSVRRAIDGMMEGETNTDVIRVLTGARRRIDEQLATHVPGIKALDDQYREMALQTGAVDTGQQLLDSGRTAVRPDELTDLMASQPVGQNVGPTAVPFRLSQGARAEIDRIIGTTGNNLTALKSALKGDGSWNRDRLAQLFGPRRADALLEVLERELTYQRSYNTVTQNSETAARTAAQKEAAPSQFERSGLTVADLLVRVPQMAANTVARTRSEGLNAEIANLLINPPSPELVDQLLAARRADRGRIGSAVAPYLLTDR